MPVLQGNNSGPIEIYWQKRGQGDPVVLVGGLTSTLEVWGHQTSALSSQYCVISFDNRGSGRTHIMQGAVHLVIFAAFLFLAFVP